MGVSSELLLASYISVSRLCYISACTAVFYLDVGVAWVEVFGEIFLLICLIKSFVLDVTALQTVKAVDHCLLGEVLWASLVSCGLLEPRGLVGAGAGVCGSWHVPEVCQNVFQRV